MLCEFSKTEEIVNELGNADNEEKGWLNIIKFMEK